MSSSSFSRPLTSALGQSLRASRSSAAGYRVSPSPRLVSCTHASSSSPCSSQPSSSRMSMFSTSALRSTQHETDEAPARTHRRPLNPDNREDQSGAPRNNATRDKDEAIQTHHEAITDIEGAFQRGPEGQAGESGARDPTQEHSTVAEAAESGMSQASIGIAEDAAFNSHTPPVAPRIPSLQPEGYGYTANTLPSRSHPTVELVINLLMKDGKKAKAQRHVLGAIKYMSEQLNTDPLPAIQEAIEIASPLLRFKRMAIGGGKATQTPIALPERARHRKAIEQIIRSASKRSEASFEVRLGKEFLAVLEGNSNALKKKEEVHKEAVRQRGNLNVPAAGR